MLDDLIENSNNDSDTKIPAKSRQIYGPSNDLPSLEKEKKSFNGKKNLLRNQLQGYQQGHNTLSSSLGTQPGRKKISGEKIRGKKGNRDRKSHYKEKRWEKISKVYVNYHMIHKW